MRIGNNGNVAIGTTDTATYKLNVNGTIIATSVLVGGNPVSGSKWSTTPSTTNIFYNSGNVGIGVTNPVYKLHFKSTYDSIPSGLHIDASDTTDPNTYALTIYPYVIGGGEVGYKFRTQNLTGGTNTPLTLNNSGNAVIQNNLTAVSLTSSGTIQSFGAYYFASSLWHKCNASNDRLYFAPNATTYIKGGTTLGRVITFRNGGDQDIGYFNDFYFYCYGPGNLSDSRIKRDIEEINDETALNMLLLVQPTTYYYRDEARNKGNGKVYGFIAQQIKEVIPDAVMMTKDIIANIYKTCLIYNKREIYHSIPQHVEIDTEVLIYDKKE
jgi:hypothetical protein